MKPILVVAPNVEIESYAREIAAEYTDVQVELALYDNAVVLAKEYVEKGVEIIISRGGTAKLLKKFLPEVPILEMKVSLFEVVNAINSAKKYGDNICVVGFRNILEDVHNLSEILNVKLTVEYFDDEGYWEEFLNSLISEGKTIDALLGGVTAEKIAKEYNIPSVPIKMRKDDIEKSILEARQLLKFLEKNKKMERSFELVFDHIKEGVIVLDSDKNIEIFKPISGLFSYVDENNIVGKPIDEVINDKEIIDLANDNESVNDQIIDIQGNKILINKFPLQLENKNFGIIITFEDITEIKKNEEIIRKELLDKGHIAKYNFSDVKGESPEIVKIKNNAKKISESESTILIYGESGTGKELLAQSIHNASPRKNKPFVAVNCASLTKNLMESELFGYEGGAFTGSKREGKRGLFAEAHLGTIFLDEIGEIPMEIQANLLRVLQEKEIKPVGSNRIIPIDVRIIAATNKNLLGEVKQGNFREDLFYRLNVLEIIMPPLRERRSDIPLLARIFIDKLKGSFNHNIEIEDSALEELSKYDYPGNIRELGNILERILILFDGKFTQKNVRNFFIQENSFINKYEKQSLENKKDLIDLSINEEEPPTLEDVKLEYIYKILDKYDGNQTQASKVLDISRTQLWRILNDKS